MAHAEGNQTCPSNQFSVYGHCYAIGAPYIPNPSGGCGDNGLMCSSIPCPSGYAMIPIYINGSLNRSQCVNLSNCPSGTISHDNTCVIIGTGQQEPNSFKQIKNEILSHNAICKAEFVLIKKLSTNSVACVKPQTAQKLVTRGWGILITQSSPLAQNQTITKPLGVSEVIQNVDSLYNKTITVYGQYTPRYPFSLPECAWQIRPNAVPTYDNSYYLAIPDGQYYLSNSTSTYSGITLEVKIINFKTNTTITSSPFHSGKLVALEGILEKQYTPSYCFDRSYFHKSAYLLVDSNQFSTTPIKNEVISHFEPSVAQARSSVIITPDVSVIDASRGETVNVTLTATHVGGKNHLPNVTLTTRGVYCCFTPRDSYPVDLNKMVTFSEQKIGLKFGESKQIVVHIAIPKNAPKQMIDDTVFFSLSFGNEENYLYPDLYIPPMGFSVHILR